MSKPNNLELLKTVVAGSRGRNLHVTEADVDAGFSDRVSDVDVRRLFVRYPGAEWMVNADTSTFYKGDGKDETYTELREFVRQLNKGSVEAHELLWVKDAETNECNSPEWQLLQNYRSQLLTQSVVERLLSAAGKQDGSVLLNVVHTFNLRNDTTTGSSMVKQAVKEYVRSETYTHGENSRQDDLRSAFKQMSDVLRRLFVAEHLLMTNVLGEPQMEVYYNDNDRRRTAMKDVKLGKWRFDLALEYRNELYERVNELYDKTKLPEKTEQLFYTTLLQTAYLRTKDAKLEY